MSFADHNNYVLREDDIETITTKDSGKGGQHRNKTESCVIMIHRPTGISAKAADRKQGQNKTLARQILENKVAKHYQDIKSQSLNTNRKQQIGSGMRGDKIKTYREKDNVVIDHRTNQKMRLSEILKGNLH